MQNLSNFIVFQNLVRNFFCKQGFLDVAAPPMVKNPGMETHIHPFSVTKEFGSDKTNYFLHTSPEFYMKKLLACGMKNIFTLSHCFRDEPISEYHNPQFLMLEWYRRDTRYETIMQDCQDLLSFVAENLEEKDIPLQKTSLQLAHKTVAQIFMEVLQIPILEYLDTKSIRDLIKEKFPDIYVPKENMEWEDYYFLLFLNKIEPKLKDYPALLLYEYPHHLSALSTIKRSDPRICERFEIYLNGIEICNCFNELTDLQEQKRRFDLQAREKFNRYGYNLPEPTTFYQILEKLPPSSGIALGMERLYYALTGVNLLSYKES